MTHVISECTLIVKWSARVNHWELCKNPGSIINVNSTNIKTKTNKKNTFLEAKIMKLQETEL